MLDKKTIKQDNKGAILLLSVMILSTILTAALGTGTLVMNIINQSASIDYSIAAFYAAEAGIEKYLYKIRQDDFGDQIGLKIYGVPVVEYDPVSLIEEENLQSSYSLSAINGQDQIVVDLYENIEYQLNMYNPNAEQEALTISRLDIIGAGTNTEDVTLHVSWVSWSAVGQLQTPGADIQIVSAGDTQEHHISALVPSSLYKIRFKILDGDLKNVTIKAYSGDIEGDPVAIPGEYVLRSEGVYPVGKAKRSSQVMTVRMPIIAPTYGLYNFVIFSEGDIAKSVTWGNE